MRRILEALRRATEVVRLLPFALGRPPAPRSLTIDPIARCNLRCPLCPTGRGHRTSPGKGILSMELYRKILNEFPKLEKLHVFNWGEPLLHPQISEMIRLAADRGISVEAHSNLSIKKDDPFFEALVGSGLDVLYVSLDGASPERYSAYRVGGDFDLVISNIERIVRARRRVGATRPRVVWKFIVNRHNEDEIETARERARSLGVEFMTTPIGLSDDLPDYDIAETLEERRAEWLPRDVALRAPAYRDEQTRTPLYPGKCSQLFERPIITPNGDVMPCCWATHPGNAFGNLEETSFREIWNGEAYRYSRSLFVRPLSKRARSTVTRNVCTTCTNFSQRGCTG